MAYSVASSITSEGLIDSPKTLLINMPSTERLPASIRDELRRAVALYCMDIVYRKDSMKVAQMRSLMFDLYHGNDTKDIISHVKLLCNGEGVFADLFEERIETVVSKHTQTSVSTLHLKQLFSRSEKHFYVGRHITVETMQTVSFNSKTLATGRMLLSQAKDTLKTIKKACAELKQLVNEDGTPKKSGETTEDVVNQLLEIMFHSLKGKRMVEDEVASPSKNKNDGGEDASDVDSSINAGDDASSRTSTRDNVDYVGDEPVRPNDWTFHGLMAVLLFGPMATPDKRLKFFLNSDPLPGEKKSLGRAAARESKMNEDMAERSINAGMMKGKRGMTVVERVQLATLELNVGRFDKESNEHDILMLKFEADMLEKKIDRATDRAKLRNDFSKVDELELELDAVRARMASFRDKTTAGIKRCRELLSGEDDSSKEKESDLSKEKESET